MSDASYRAGALAVLSVAEKAAAAIRSRPDAAGIGQRAAAEALEAFSAAVRCRVAPEPRNAVLEALRAIRALPGDEGEIECPDCAGRLRWTRDASNRHVWGQCETDDCLRWMQ